MGRLQVNSNIDLYFNNVSLLLPFDNNFQDYSKNNFNVTVNGSPQISTTQSKYGGAAGHFDGNGDYLEIADNDAFELQGDDFTIECWINVTSLKGYQAIANKSYNTTDQHGWLLYFETNPPDVNEINFLVGNGSWSVFLQSNFTPSLSTWYHVAVSRSGNTWRLFVDGDLKASTTNSIVMNTGNLPMYIGRYPHFPGANLNQTFEGYIDDFRITKGVARYTSNFTPPSKLRLNINNKISIKKQNLGGGRLLITSSGKLSQTMPTLLQILEPTTQSYGFGHTLSFNDIGNILGVTELGGSVGAAYLYTGNGNSWQCYPTSFVNNPGDFYYGYASDLNGIGNRFFVGAPQAEPDTVAGAVFQYEINWQTNSYSQKKIILNPPTGEFNYFGYSVKTNTSGDIVIIGSPFYVNLGGNQTPPNGQDLGRAYIFSGSGEGMFFDWGTGVRIEPKIKQSYFGYSVDITDDPYPYSYLIGAPQSSGLSFDINSTGRGVILIQKTGVPLFYASSSGNQSFLGYSVAISNDKKTMVFGAPGENGSLLETSGYKRNGKVFILEDGSAGFLAEGKRSNHYFGSNICLSKAGNVLAVGTYNSQLLTFLSLYGGPNPDFSPFLNTLHDAYSGEVYIYTKYRDENNLIKWKEAVTITGNGYCFGHGLALNASGNLLAISNNQFCGTDLELDPATGSSNIYVYDISQFLGKL